MLLIELHNSNMPNHQIIVNIKAKTNYSKLKLIPCSQTHSIMMEVRTALIHQIVWITIMLSDPLTRSHDTNKQTTLIGCLGLKNCFDWSLMSSSVIMRPLLIKQTLVLSGFDIVLCAWWLVIVSRYQSRLGFIQFEYKANKTDTPLNNKDITKQEIIIVGGTINSLTTLCHLPKGRNKEIIKIIWILSKTPQLLVVCEASASTKNVLFWFLWSYQLVYLDKQSFTADNAVNNPF